ncbi:MAG: acetylxylan esterase [Lentisphaerae bacterium]|nr:acetylxylan esterase [Lentisphaerota bacterium]
MIEHNFPFDPYNGMTQNELLKITAPAEPEGFRRFWEDNYRLVMACPLDYHVETEVWSPVESDTIYRVRVKNFDGVEFIVFIARPENSAGGLVIGQGYGNPSTPPSSSHGLTTCFANVRGLGASQCKDIPWQPAQHVIHGIESKETYILRGVIADQWMATRVMLDMFPDCAENLHYYGGSMGGGMGALMLPWDDRFKSGFLSVPTFGSEIRFNYESVGSGEACRKYVQEHPEALDVLRYFDASVAAKYIRIPVCCTPALFDPCVAPAGQFSVANSIPDEFKTLYIRETGHFELTEQDKIVSEKEIAWCKKQYSKGEIDNAD